ncbi:uncharacterized protein LOC119464673 [Dermacentor silvarum]|uniref:uncharacterized protein LOC119464673 n=1 Tax=Dermacentor silvarum TaxID=543639 RepID=UPI002101ABEE|nr:uncharacterized protein LOC119464673 [Dermacentor silvarum]
MTTRSASGCTWRKQSTSIYCCVCGCHNSNKNTAGKLPKVQFYHFPWKSYEADRRQRWIAAVRRDRPNGDLWQPVQRKTVICNAHFVGNKASTIAGHPAYVPTVFPPCYRRSDAVLPASKLDRYKRVQRRRAVLQAPTSKSAITATADSFEDSSIDLADEIIASPEETGTSASVMTQTDADFNGGVCTLFLCDNRRRGIYSSLPYRHCRERCTSKCLCEIDSYWTERAQLCISWLQFPDPEKGCLS